jgi:ligand-binding sensor domain-containing protein
MKIAYILLPLLVFAASCKGQANTKQLEAGGSEAVTAGPSKLLKTQSESETCNVRCGIQDRAGNLWFGTTGQGVYRYDGKTFTQFTIKEGLSSNFVWSILEDKDGYIWLGTTDGICRFDGKKISMISLGFNVRPIISKDYYYTKSSTKNTVWSMMQDKSGKIWFGCGDGVYCYDGARFSRFLAYGNIVNKDSLQLKVVSAIVEDKENIWFASGMPPGSEGLCRYDGKMIESLKPQNQTWIRSLVKSSYGNLLLATRSAGIFSYDGNTFTPYTQPPELINGSLATILEDKAGNLWIGSDYGKNPGDTLGGLWRSNTSGGKTDHATFSKISNKEVNFLLEDKDNNIWFGTRGMGLYRYDGQTITSFTE